MVHDCLLKPTDTELIGRRVAAAATNKIDRNDFANERSNGLGNID